MMPDKSYGDPLKIVTAMIVLFFLPGCQTNSDNTNIEINSYPFFVGTYTTSDSKGIYKYTLQKDGSLKYIGLAAISNNPSFLTMSVDKNYLLAVNEINNNGAGMVESFLIKGDSLIFLSRSPSGGADPCFVSVNQAGFVLAANYNGGNVGLLRINQRGELSALLDVQTHTRNSLNENRGGVHAHAAWFEPVTNNIISVDLGTNQLWFSHLDTINQKLKPSDPHNLEMQPGAGPRHLVFHPNGRWLYIINEINSTITLLQKSENGQYLRSGSVSTLPADYSERNSGADIHISSDGKYVYASNRGHNSIAIFKVNADDGSLNLVAHQSTLGNRPRNFSLSPDDNYLLVANQRTNNIVSFKRDKTSGLLDYADQIEAPTPVCILF